MIVNTPIKKLLGGYEFKVIDPDAIMAAVELGRYDGNITVGAGFYLVEHRGTGLCMVGRTASLRRTIYYAACGHISKWLKDNKAFDPADYFFYIGTRLEGSPNIRGDKGVMNRELGVRGANKHRMVYSPVCVWDIHILIHRATGMYFITSAIQLNSPFNLQRVVSYFHDYRTRRHQINNVPLRNFVEKHPELTAEDFDLKRLDYNIPSRARADELKKAYMFSHGTDKCLSMGVGRKHWKLYPIALKEIQERHGDIQHVR